SWAALRPPMPPPSTITVLDTVSSCRSTDRVHVVGVRPFRRPYLANAQAMEAIEPPIPGIGGQQANMCAHRQNRGPALERSPPIPALTEIDRAGVAQRDQDTIAGLQRDAGTQDPDPVRPDNRLVPPTWNDPGVERGSIEGAAHRVPVDDKAGRCLAD